VIVNFSNTVSHVLRMRLSHSARLERITMYIKNSWLEHHAIADGQKTICSGPRPNHVQLIEFYRVMRTYIARVRVCYPLPPQFHTSGYLLADFLFLSQNGGTAPAVGVKVRHFPSKKITVAVNWIGAIPRRM